MITLLSGYLGYTPPPTRANILLLYSNSTIAIPPFKSLSNFFSNVFVTKTVNPVSVPTANNAIISLIREYFSLS